MKNITKEDLRSLIGTLLNKDFNFISKVDNFAVFKYKDTAYDYEIMFLFNDSENYTNKEKLSDLLELDFNQIIINKYYLKSKIATKVYHFKLTNSEAIHNNEILKNRIEYLENKMKRKDSYINKMIKINNEYKESIVLKDKKIKDLELSLKSMIYGYNKKVKECDHLFEQQEKTKCNIERNLNVALRMKGYNLDGKLIKTIVKLVELIEQKGDNTTMKDVFEP